MTSSFGISPQRQVRNLEAQPEAPAALPKPAAPRQIPQQLGGQLMYGATFQEDTAAKQAVKALEDFMSQEGLFQTRKKKGFESFKEEKKAQAERLLASEATAYKDTLNLSNEISQVKGKNPELASEMRTSNPWLDFFYYEAKATNAGREVALDLANWGKRSKGVLAGMPADQQGALIAQKTQELLKPYADLPEAFIAAKVDPVVGATIQDLKADVTNESFKQNELKIKNTAAQQFLGTLRMTAKYSDLTGRTEFDTKSIETAVLQHRNYLIELNQYSPQEATDELIRLIDSDQLHFDANDDELNDIGRHYTGIKLRKALGSIKIDGISLLNLTGSDGDPLHKALDGAIDRAVKRTELREGQIERIFTREQQQVKRNLENASTAWWLENKNPTYQDIDKQRAVAKAEIAELAKAGRLPEGFNKNEAEDFVDRIYKYPERELEKGLAAQIMKDVERDIANGTTQIPNWVEEATKGTNLWPTVIEKYAAADRKASTEEVSLLETTREGIVENVVKGLKGSFQQDQNYLDTVKLPSYKTQARDLLNQAVKEATPILTLEANRLVMTKLRQARQKGVDITDAAYQTTLQREVEQALLARPEYSDVDLYRTVNLTGGAKNFGKVTSPVPILSKKDDTGRWTNQINDTDNRAAWSAVAKATYGNDPQAAKNLLNSQLVLNNFEIQEMLKAGVGKGRLSQATKQSLVNLSQVAFNGNVSVEEILKSQYKTYTGLDIPPEVNKALESVAKTVRTAYVVQGNKPEDIGIRVFDWKHSHSKKEGGSGNNGVDITPVTNSGQLGVNFASPVSGTVIHVGYDGGYGLSVIIRATSSGPGYNYGDRIRFAHLAATNLEKGKSITVGRSLGRSSKNAEDHTGTGDPGHIHVQRYRPGDGYPYQGDQYDQPDQQDFIRQAVFPLYRKK